MSKTVFAFGRMNPPTIGHQKLADKVKSEAKKQGAMPHVYLSHTQNAKKDPLSYADKIKYARKAFGPSVTKSKSKTIIQVLQELQKMGHTEVTLVAGSDRVGEFKTFLNKYNGKDYSFDKINVISAGQRDPDAEGAAGMSATKIRGLAQSGDLDGFSKGITSGLNARDKKAIYNKVRNVMGISESIEYDDSDFEFTEEELDAFIEMTDLKDLDEDYEIDEELDEAVLTLPQRLKRARMMRRLAPRIKRKRAIAMRKMADTKRLERRSRKAAVKLLRKRFGGKQGANYASLAPGAKIAVDRIIDKKRSMVAKISKRLLPKVRKAEMERLKKVRGGPSSKKESFDQSFENYLAEACWDGYKQEGMKKKGKRMVPNCVPEETIFEDESQETNQKLLYMLRQAFTNATERQLVIRALKGGSKSLQNPKLRPFILKLLNRLLDATQSDPTMFVKMKDRLRRMSQDDSRKDDVEEAKRPAQYHAGLSKSTSDKRASHFKKQGDKPDDQASAYKPAPGDARAKTKTSKHTSKFKAMYGEAEDKEITIGGYTTKYFYMCPSALKAMKKNPDVDGAAELTKLQDDYFKLEKKVMDNGSASDEDKQKAQSLYDRTMSKAKAAGIEKEVNAYMIDHLNSIIKGDPKPGFGMVNEDYNYEFEKFISEQYIEEKSLDGLKKKAEKSGIPYSILKQVYNRGMAAWKTGHRPGTTPQQWAYARVNSFATKSKGTWGGADKDLASKARGSKKEEVEIDEAKTHFVYQRNVVKTKSIVHRGDEKSSREWIKKNSKYYDHKGKAFDIYKGKPGKVSPRDIVEEIELDEITLARLKGKIFGKIMARDKKEKLKQMIQDKGIPAVSKMFGISNRELEAITEMRKSPLQRLKDFDKTRVAVGKKPIFNPKSTEFRNVSRKQKKLDQTSNEDVDAAKERIKREKESDKAKHDRMMDRARTRQTQAKNRATESIDNSFENYLIEVGGAGEFATDKLKKKYAKDTPYSEETYDGNDFDEAYGMMWFNEDEELDEAEFQGRKVQLGKPSAGDVKKFKVYVKNEKGNVVKVNFGDPNMTIKKHIPARRKSFRARHNCDNPGPRTKARYWSCKKW